MRHLIRSTLVKPSLHLEQGISAVCPVVGTSISTNFSSCICLSFAISERRQQEGTIYVQDPFRCLREKCGGAKHRNIAPTVEPTVAEEGEASEEWVESIGLGET